MKSLQPIQESGSISPWLMLMSPVHLLSLLMRSLLQLPLSVMLIGSWRLALTSQSHQFAEVFIQEEKQQQLPDLTLPPPGTGITGDPDSAIDQDLLLGGQRLGIKVISGTPQLQG